MIKNPHALPMYREDPGRKRGREKARNVSTWLAGYYTNRLFKVKEAAALLVAGSARTCKALWMLEAYTMQHRVSVCYLVLFAPI
jgi:hypothetical protein